MKDIVLVNIPADAALQARMRAAAPEMDFHFTTPGAPAPLYGEARIAFGRFVPPKDAAAGAFPYPKKLEWLQIVSSGADWYLNALPKSVTLTSGTGSYGTVISEFMVGQILSLYYKLALYRDQQRLDVWAGLSYPTTIRNKRVLLFGLGDVGSHFARLMDAFGAQVIGVRRRALPIPPGVARQYTFDEPGLEGEFIKADIIAMCMPNTPDAVQTLHAARIGMLKPSAIVVNVGRGNAIDQEALVHALEAGRIAGAALDVFASEPLASGHPLFSLPNVLVTPHIAGHDFAPAVIEKTVALFFENLAAFRAGKPLKYVVDRDAKYAL